MIDLVYYPSVHTQYKNNRLSSLLWALLFLLLNLWFDLFWFLFLCVQEKVVFSGQTFLLLRFILNIKIIELFIFLCQIFLDIVHDLLLEFNCPLSNLAVGEKTYVFQVLREMFDVVEFPEPFRVQLFVKRDFFFDLPQFFGYFAFFDVHNLFVLLSDEKLFSFLLFEIFFSFSELLFYGFQFFQFSLVYFFALFFQMFHHPLEVSFLFVQLMSLVGSLAFFDLMEAVEVEFVIGVIVVVLFFEAIACVFAHQQYL